MRTRASIRQQRNLSYQKHEPMKRLCTLAFTQFRMQHRGWAASAFTRRRICLYRDEPMPRRQPLGLKERQRILELARQGLSAQQIAQRLGITLKTARKILAKGLAQCGQCGRVFASEDRCPV